jgi:multiple sugar transport system substrate-binding protein
MQAEKRSRRELLKYLISGVVGIGIGYTAGILTKTPEVKYLTTTQATTVTRTETVAASPVVTTPVAWSLKEAARPYRGASIRIIGEFLPPLEAVAKLKDQFEDETGITVEVEMYEHTQVVEKVTFDLSAGAGIYDVILNPHREIGKLAENGWLVPLNKYLSNPALTPPGFDPYKEFWKGVTGTFRGIKLKKGIFGEICDYKGTIYGLPDKTITRHLWYRKDLWNDPTHKKNVKDRYGFDIPSPWDLTTDQYMKLAEYFTNPGSKFPQVEYGTCIEGKRHPALWYSYLDWLHAYGGQVIDQASGDEYGKVVINEKEGIDALQYMVDLLPYCPPGTLSYFWDDAMAAMQQGLVSHTLMWNDATFAYVDPSDSKVAAELGARNACGFGPVPIHPEKRLKIFQVEGWYAGIPLSSKNKEAAWLFMIWMTSPMIELEKHLKGGATGRPDVAKKIVEEFDKLEAEGRMIPGVELYTEVAYRLYTEYEYIPKPTFPEQETIVEIIIEAVSKALTKDLTPKDALDWAAEQMKEKIPKLS